MLLIPEAYRRLAGIAAFVVLLALAAIAGALVNGWRLDGAHQRELAAKQKDYDELAAKVQEQNRGIEALQAKTDAAEGRRQLAELFASGALERAGNRAAGVANSKATSCDGVLKEAWEAWK